MTKPRPKLKLIGITGYAGSGKSTLADAIRLECARKLVPCSVFSIASTVKNAFCEATGMDRELLETRKRDNKLVRYYLQVTGDWLKEHGQHPVDALSRFLSEKKETEVILIPDLRFLDEEELIRLYGGKIVRVERPGFRGCNTHSSETEQDKIGVDYTVRNNQTTRLLELEAKNILSLFNYV